ncbi:hypothetical protein PUR22_03645 [Mycolicibacterium porcinum]|uniref:hypothetical protein n=1 Tax=Mycolicibacterium porcinum TaxID=39693 RepID=UPI0031F90FBF
MTSIDYSFFHRQKILPGELASLRFDVFISSFNSSDRVQRVFSNVNSQLKIWLRHPEYGYDDREIDQSHEWFVGDKGESEADFWLRFLADPRWRTATSSGNERVAFDITGMMRNHIILLPRLLAAVGVKHATFLYSDPKAYSGGTKTPFAIGVEKVAQVPGFEGVHNTSTNTRDALIIGAGYDDFLIRSVAEYKRSADHYILLGLPSLQPHMYQESQVRVHAAQESIHNFRSRSFLFAPASDPFMTAQIISDQVSSLRQNDPELNVYLSPVGAKAQVLGFAWFYLCECSGDATSIIFPYSSGYEKETSTGISRVHLFEMEFDWVR